MKTPLAMRDLLRYVRHGSITLWERKPTKRKPTKFAENSGRVIAGESRSDAELFGMLCSAEAYGWVTHTHDRSIALAARLSAVVTHSFLVTDAGRLEAREHENLLAPAEARAMDDSILREIWGDHPTAQRVLNGRTKATAHIRLIVARVYARGDLMSFHGWHVIPCLTDKDTLGVLDITTGTAWETGVAALPEVDDLGTIDEVYAAANGHSGTVSFDGVPVQSQGTAVQDGKVIPPTMPYGWKQIALPTWRGYEGTSPARSVPSFEFRPETWIKPTLVATGLKTCYGGPGTDPGVFLTKAHGWESQWPHGIPEWIEGRSVSLIDAIATSYTRTNLPRASEAEETACIQRALIEAKKILADRLRLAGSVYTVIRNDQVRNQFMSRSKLLALAVKIREDGKELISIADRLLGGEDVDMSTVRSACCRGGNQFNWAYDHGASGGADAVLRAEEALLNGCPWEAARYLGLGTAFSNDLERLMIAAKMDRK